MGCKGSKVRILSRRPLIHKKGCRLVLQPFFFARKNQNSEPFLRLSRAAAFSVNGAKAGRAFFALASLYSLHGKHWILLLKEELLAHAVYGLEPVFTKKSRTVTKAVSPGFNPCSQLEAAPGGCTRRAMPALQQCRLLPLQPSRLHSP